jgi:hypothetical protein
LAVYTVFRRCNVANSQTGTIKDRLERLGPYRLGEPNPGAAERARAIKRRQKERGVRFADSTEMVRADRDSRA